MKIKTPSQWSHVTLFITFLVFLPMIFGAFVGAYFSIMQSPIMFFISILPLIIITNCLYYYFKNKKDNSKHV